MNFASKYLEHSDQWKHSLYIDIYLCVAVCYSMIAELRGATPIQHTSVT